MGFWLLVAVGAAIGWYSAQNRGALVGGIVGAALAFVFHFLQQRALATDAAARQGIMHLREQHRLGNLSLEQQQEFEGLMEERRQRGLWPFDASSQEYDSKAVGAAQQEQARSGSAAGLTRAINRVGTWVLIVVPIVWSGRDNLREQLGYGVGRPWDSWSAIVSGWSFWIVSIGIWIVIVRAITGWIDRKLSGSDIRGASPQ